MKFAAQQYEHAGCRLVLSASMMCLPSLSLGLVREEFA